MPNHQQPPPVRLFIQQALTGCAQLHRPRIAIALLVGLLCGWSWLGFGGQRATGAAAATPVAQGSPDGVWLPLAQDGLSRKPLNVAAGRRFHSVSLQEAALLQRLAEAPAEDSKAPRAIVSLPLPDGSFARFALEESSNMDSALALRFPEIKSYRAVAVDDATMIARVAWSPRGLRALIATPETAYSVEPVGDLQYVSYDDAAAVAPGNYECLTEQLPDVRPAQPARLNDVSALSLGTQRRNYRLAMATTHEYTTNVNLGGGTKASAIASVNEWMNAVNLIYERDLSAHFNLVANNDQLIYDTANDPFTNDGAASQATTMLEQVRAHLNSAIGSANYDVGHLLGVGPSGIAYLSVACVNDPYKGGGVSLIPSSVGVGHPFYIGRIAHELGHQFGTAHTFNDNSGSCAAARSTTQSYESGSGFTIMAYSGSCNAIATSRALHFHSSAIKAMAEFMQFEATCATTAATGNRAPIVNAGSDYRIPKRTPFTLTANANDPDSDDNAKLSYSWEQFDAGGTSFGNPAFTDDGDPATTTRPIFRPLAPANSPTRLFPELAYQQYYQNEPPLQLLGLYPAQHLPRVTRSLNFKVIVRDQRGGVADDDVLLNVDGAAGPFLVTAPNTGVIWTGGTQQTVTWSVNSTNNAPISCANVKLSLSQDNGLTFPITILSSTPNDGSQTITVPAGANSSQARLKVEAVGNIFYDISDVAFTIYPGAVSCHSVSALTPASATIGSTLTLTGNNLTGVDGVRFSNNVAAMFTVVSNTQINVTVPSGAVTGPLTLTKAGCASVQTSTFTPAACTYSLSTPGQSVPATATTASVNVTTSTGCAWTTSNSNNWITITSGASGSGNGTVNLSIAANTGAARTGNVTIAGKTFAVSQAANCTINLASSGASVASTGGTGSVSVTAGTNCPWMATAAGNQTWLTIIGGATGIGNGSVSYAATSNAGATRSAIITVAGKNFTVTQPGCGFALSENSFQFFGWSFSRSVEVKARAECAWRALSNVNWMSVTAGANGAGDGTVTFLVSSNPGATRTGTLTIAGLTYTVTQSGGCAFSLSASSASYAAAGGTGSFNVINNTNCDWSAIGDQAWVFFTNGSNGSGNGTVNFNVTPNNTASARTAKINVSGAIFTVNQAAGCVYTVTLGTQIFPAAAATFNATVATAAGCAWTASSNQSWATFESGASGTGNGTVRVKLAANTTQTQRSATLTIAGRTIFITQDANCSITLANDEISVSSSAGTSTLALTTNPAGCAYTASVGLYGATWLTVTEQTSNKITFSYKENNDFERFGLVTIGGRNLTVRQAEKPANCNSVFFTPASHSAPYAGGSYNVEIITGRGCAWNATTSTPWILLNPGSATGVRRGKLAYTLLTNTTTQARTGTIQFNGQSFAVTQAAAPVCTYNVTPTSLTVSPNGGTALVSLKTSSNCFWLAAANDSAVKSVAGGSGLTSGDIVFEIQPNAAPTARTSKLYVAGQTVTVTQAGGATSNPLPAILSLSPYRMDVNEEPVNDKKLTVYGKNFMPNSVVRWNGVERVTTFVSSQKLIADFEEGDLAWDMKHQVSVLTPPSATGAGGGLSNIVDYLVPSPLSVVSAADYDYGTVARDSIVSVFGRNLAASIEIGKTLPLPATLGGTTVTFYDRDGRSYPSSLFFVSPGQINCLIPPTLPTGITEMFITLADGTFRLGSFAVDKVNPGLFTARADGGGLIAGQLLRVRNGVQTYESIGSYNFATQQETPLPIDFGPSTDQLFLVVYGTGIRYRTDLNTALCYLSSSGREEDGIAVKPLFAGAQGAFVGLDQVNVPLPRSLAGKGQLSLWLKVDGLDSNHPTIHVK